jgi:hypothetical protein
MARTIGIVALIVLLLLGGYVGVYFGCSELIVTFGDLELNLVAYRMFPEETPTGIFKPLAVAESWWRGYDVVLGEFGGPEPVLPRLRLSRAKRHFSGHT